MATDLRHYLIAFLMTIALELGTATLLGYRKRSELAAVFWVNVFSHPLVCCLIWVVGQWQLTPVNTNEILLFEAGVVLVEWQLLCYALPKHSRAKLLLLSLTMNIVSYYSPSPIDS